ncbi:putative post-GPI attachment to proteins factor 3-like [Capsicum annuum]|nr:putative post-GPI attachment to proteins factor 3-like [Capsicum annuum]
MNSNQSTGEISKQLLLNLESGRDVEASTSKNREMVMEEKNNGEPVNSSPKEVESKGKSTEENKWTNLFQRNGVVENGMALNYIPTQLIKGEIVVQLENKGIQVKFTDNLQAQEKKVLQELEKWSMVEESVMRPKTRPGKSIIHQVYYANLPNIARVTWKLVMYKNAASPKAKFTTWMLMWERMLTVDHLTKWGMQLDTKCSRCSKYDETKEHLFTQCEYLVRIWDKVTQWMKIPRCAADN